MNRYKNLWRDDTQIKSPEYYENDARKIGEHRGVSVLKLYNESFDFVLAGACIAQRAGASEWTLTIDNLLDGVDCCSDKVAAHIAAQGFRPLSYGQYNKDYTSGLRD